MKLSAFMLVKLHAHLVNVFKKKSWIKTKDDLSINHLNSQCNVSQVKTCESVIAWVMSLHLIISINQRKYNHQEDFWQWSECVGKEKRSLTLELTWLNEFSLSLMNISQNPMFIVELRTWRNYNFDMKN